MRLADTHEPTSSLRTSSLDAIVQLHKTRALERRKTLGNYIFRRCVKVATSSRLPTRRSGTPQKTGKLWHKNSLPHHGRRVTMATASPRTRSLCSFFSSSERPSTAARDCGCPAAGSAVAVRRRRPSTASSSEGVNDTGSFAWGGGIGFHLEHMGRGGGEAQRRRQYCQVLRETCNLRQLVCSNCGRIV